MLDVERSGSVPRTSGFRSGRPKNILDDIAERQKVFRFRPIGKQALTKGEPQQPTERRQRKETLTNGELMLTRENLLLVANGKAETSNSDQ